MSLADRIEKDFIIAYKAKDELSVSVLRMLKTAVKNRQVELMRPPTDEEVLAVVAKQVKQRQESVEQFTAAGRSDLAAKEAAEKAVLESYLPARLSDEELTALVEEAVAASGAAGMKDMGKVMQLVMVKAAGRADGKLLSQLVKSRLSA
ncbi:MAG: GatB/YqeY domain-containing protein [Thermodesulfobacteriota bacterium]